MRGPSPVGEFRAGLRRSLRDGRLDLGGTAHSPDGPPGRSAGIGDALLSELWTQGWRNVEATRRKTQRLRGSRRALPAHNRRRAENLSSLSTLVSNMPDVKLVPAATATSSDLARCSEEPIHIPGAIQ